VFKVQFEGGVVTSDPIDIVLRIGVNRAYKLEYFITVADEELNIESISLVSNAQINGIEIHKV
jgi:hypothetical protein